MSKFIINKKGVALLISLWILIILSLIVGSLSIEMNIEGLLLSKKRKKFNAEMLAHSGIDYSRSIIEMKNKANELEIDNEDDFMKSALYVKKGLKVLCLSQLPIWELLKLKLKMLKLEEI